MSDVTRQTYRELSEIDKEAVAKIKAAGEAFLDLLDERRQSRETSLAKTKIEEAVMWAVKGITA